MSIVDIKGNILDKEIIVNVKNFGAKGDGVTDDSLAIQKALDSVKKGGHIYIPEGVYLVSKSLLFYSNQTVFGDNATLLQKGALNNIMRNFNDGKGGYEATHDSRIIGLTFDGGENTVQNTLLGCSHSYNISFEKCTFKHGYGGWHDIEINSTKYATIKDCIFTESRRTHQKACMIQVDVYDNTTTWPWMDGIVDMTPCEVVVIQNNKFECNGVSPAIGNHSVKPSFDIILSDNLFLNDQGTRGTVCFDRSEGTIVKNNIFKNCLKPITTNGNSKALSFGNIKDGVLMN